MNKEAIGKIAKLDYMWRFCGIPDECESEWERETECIKQSCRGFARDVIKTMEELGYRKLPKDKPPLLSDGEFREKFQKLEEQYKEVNMPWFWGKQVARAQREADIKWYE